MAFSIYGYYISIPMETLGLASIILKLIVHGIFES